MTHWEIKTFIEIVKYKSVSKAAKKLYLTQSTVSHRINVLEEELGVKLIIRRKGYRSIELTQAGEAFLPLAYEYQALWERIAAFSQNSSKTVFSIGCHDSLNSFIFCKLLSCLVTDPENEKKHMTFRLESHTTEEIYQLLESGHINIAFIRDSVENRNFVIEPLFAEPFKVIVPLNSQHLSGEISPEALDRKKEIDLSSSWGADFIRWHEEIFGKEWMPDISINAISTLTKYLVDPEQWAIVPVSVSEELLRCQKVRSLDIKNPPPPVVCYQVYLKSQAKVKSDQFEFFEKALGQFIATMPYLEKTGKQKDGRRPI